ncbi:hypothetical protein E4U17_003613 [Claviceps sp. LM77 group G4]|nr:hypothetical protein E4U17_003613 [Claviceps sp. LM77 group G4]KAG6076815.1 hypothetical protein E4U33_001641 [Claviceps sp. LM78 group G4]
MDHHVAGWRGSEVLGQILINGQRSRERGEGVTALGTAYEGVNATYVLSIDQVGNIRYQLVMEDMLFLPPK